MCREFALVSWLPMFEGLSCFSCSVKTPTIPIFTRLVPHVHFLARQVVEELFLWRVDGFKRPEEYVLYLAHNHEGGAAADMIDQLPKVIHQVLHTARVAKTHHFHTFSSARPDLHILYSSIIRLIALAASLTFMPDFKLVRAPAPKRYPISLSIFHFFVQIDAP